MAASDFQRVEVDGLRDFRRELRSLEGNFPKELQQTNKRVAADVIVPEARRRAHGTFPRRSGQSPVRPGSAVANSIRALASQTRAQVAIGSKRVPWALGYEFGSYEFRQFPTWRGSGSEAGYFLWPTVREKRQEVIDEYGDLIDQLSKRAFPN